MRSTGNRECGSFKNNLLHGSGEINYANGTFVEGHFEKGIYLKTVYRHKFDTMMTSVPKFKTLNDDTIFKWKQLGPLNITALEEAEKVGLIDEKVGLVREVTVDELYEGQNRTVGGIGRLITKDGSVLEGAFAKGFANGYARIINKNKDLYDGQVKNGLR